MENKEKAKIAQYLVENCEFEPYRELSDEEITALEQQSEQKQLDKLVGQTDEISTYGEPCDIEDANMIVSSYRYDDLTRLLDIILEPVPDSYVNVTAYFVFRYY